MEATGTGMHSRMHRRNLLSGSSADAADADRWWPFAAWSKPAEKVSAPPTPAPKKLEDTKKALLATAVFQKKTAALCTMASMDELKACQDAAAERLFCSMFTRHQEKFSGMSGEAAQKKKCFETNIMETSLEAAKDQQALAAASDP